MGEILTAIGLVLVIEGLAYALFPDSLRKLAARLLAEPADRVRLIGLGVAIAGLVVVWTVRG